MPRILDLIKMEDGRLGVVLDIPAKENHDGSVTLYTEEERIHVIRTAIKVEREACAKVADDCARRAFSGPHGSDVAGVAAEHIAASIRKRANYDNAPTDPHHGGKIWNG